MRDTPRDPQDATLYDSDASPKYDSVLTTPPDAPSMEDGKAESLARECYNTSTDWINASRRMKWSYSLRAFQGLHATDSKYLSADYRYRSRLYRPKTRAMVRDAEAETASAFFANADVVDIQPQDDNDKQQLASAEINKELLNYRLTKTVPWFLTLVGARQDAEVMGICIGKAFWKYEEKVVETQHRLRLDPITGAPTIDELGIPHRDAFDIIEKTVDHPWVDLVAPENFRFDPGADWRNPVATSPYLIELIPMYVADVRAKIESGEWLPVSDSAILGSTGLDDDTTRRAREAQRIPGKDNDAGKPRDFEIAWVRENIVRYQGTDFHYYTLGGGGKLLTKPRPLAEAYLQGIRPYVCGFIVPEAHKTYPASKVEMVKDLQQAANDTQNLRFDNVKLTLNPRQFVRAGKNVDVNDIKTFNPGKVVLMQDPNTDIVWDRPPEVTQSAYLEQDRINVDFDELAGGTSLSTIQANQQTYQAVGNTEMLDGNANKLGEYELRVFAETFVEPLMRQLVKLEQAYETDPVVLAIAGRQANLYQKFGINDITDELLRQELTVKVNVGTGATNPQTRLKNLSTGIALVGQIYGPAAAQGSVFGEVTKEIFSQLGYKDGSRFFKPNFDPTQVQQQGGSQAQQPGQFVDPTRVPVAQIQAQSKQQSDQADLAKAQLSARTTLEKQQMHESAETQRTEMKLRHDFAQNIMTAATQPNPLLQQLRGVPNGQPQF